MSGSTLVIVDAANVVGSVPDGWWRDREGAATRLRDSLADLATAGLPAAGLPAPVDVLLVVEGAARHVIGTDRVQVISASGSGDDAIVDLVRQHAPGRSVAVVTADRGLRERVQVLGATVIGPRQLSYTRRS